jgi:hypothetical protein
MSVLSDCLSYEADDSAANLEQLEEYRQPAERIVWYCFQLPHAGKSVGGVSAGSLARLLLDASVHIEQAFVSVLRGQPRLGWAALRIAAEATKDLDAIDRRPELHKVWLGAVSSSSSADAKKARRSFQAGRKAAGKSAVTNLCEACMELCGHLGSHSNSTSWETVGPVTEVTDDHVALPARLRDPEMLRFHVSHLIRHSVMLLAVLTRFRLQYLESVEADALRDKFTAVQRSVHAVFPDIEVRDFGSTA